MKELVVVLDHPEDPNQPGVTSNQTEVRYFEENKKLINSREPNLIEGGNQYRRKIYRPSVECMMRIESNVSKSRSGKTEWVTVPFCKVCDHELRQAFVGQYDFRFGAVRIIKGPTKCHGQMIQSRLAEKFVSFINNPKFAKPGYIPSLHRWDPNTKLPMSKHSNDPNLLCIEGTIARFEFFFNDSLKWPEADTKLTKLPGDWYSSEINLPKLEGDATNMWHIWMSDLESLRNDPEYVKGFAAMGAAGAICYTGFGCLANKLKLQTEEINGNKIKYYLAQGLTPADLKKLAPGSLLQIWREEEVYKQYVRYIWKARIDKPDFSKPPYNYVFDGHSLVYMGQDAQGRHIVADQYQVDGPLQSGWRAAYPFWIGAQWFEAANIPKLS